MMRVVLIALAFVFLTSCAQADYKNAQELTEEAQEILRETGRSEYSAAAMQLLNRAVDENPEYLPARQERLNLFLLQRKVGAAVEEAGEIAQIRDIPETRLSYCMLREFEDPDFSGRDSCYSDVAESVQATTSEPYADLNYVLALRLAGSPDFQEAAEKHVDRLQHEEVRALVEDLLFEKTREELIGSYIPHQ